MKTWLPVPSRVSFFAVVALLAIPALSPTLRAVPVTVGLNTYEITNLWPSPAPTYASDPGLFQAQAWWGNKALADQIVTALEAEPNPFGYPNFNPGHYSLLFAWGVESNGDVDSEYISSGQDYGYPAGLYTITTHPEGAYNYAGVLPVPSVDDNTSSLALMLTGLTALGFAKWRRKQVVA